MSGERVAPAVLILRDGELFEGEWIGAEPGEAEATGEGGADGRVHGRAEAVAIGEVVFNTALSGYQEIVTDPSYAGQIITFTYPHIGNYGTNPDDDEHERPFCRGIVVRDLARRASSWRSTETLCGFLKRHGVPGIAGIDTRRLTRHLRDSGAVPGAFGTDEATVRAAATGSRPTDGVDLVATVTTDHVYSYGDLDAPLHVVAYDFGIKRTILRHLAGAGCFVEVVPASTPADEVIARSPDGVFLSNGPGDPAAVAGATEAVRSLVGTGIPVFGICLGHQILGRALGGSTFKLPFGHHGANHPVRHEATGRVEITSQNHNYAVDLDSLDRGVTVTHVNLNDGVCEGLALRDEPVFSVQHHPEAGPGPHDAAYLFDEFTGLMAGVAGGTGP
ncbi:MAG: glutamine-hydrolyzing carbamoyl-phosphate synthase small subunit [Actinobacteria bacterium]|nr:glutamine-hydrolyzing carbamoyl-phosphate synthase small subunit [Actinomycetota bacterium]